MVNILIVHSSTVYYMVSILGVIISSVWDRVNILAVCQVHGLYIDYKHQYSLVQGLYI